MANPQVKQEEELEQSYGASIGTWVSLGVVLAVILGTFFLLFTIYMGRV